MSDTFQLVGPFGGVGSVSELIVRYISDNISLETFGHPSGAEV